MTKKKYSTIELEGIDASKQLVVDIFLHEGALRERERLVALMHKWQGVYMESGGPEAGAVAEFAQRVIDELELDIDTPMPYDG
jgi:hypothetical protein